MSMIAPFLEIERCIVHIDMVTLPLKATNGIYCCVISLGSIFMSNNKDKYNKLKKLLLSTKVLYTP